MYSESAAEDLLGSTKQNDDKKVTQRLLPSVITPCSQVAMQSRPKTGKLVVVLLVFLCDRCHCIRWYKGKVTVLSPIRDLVTSQLYLL